MRSINLQNEKREQFLSKHGPNKLRHWTQTALKSHLNDVVESNRLSSNLQGDAGQTDHHKTSKRVIQLRFVFL